MKFSSDRNPASTWHDLFSLLLGIFLLAMLCWFGGSWLVLAVAWLPCGLLAMLLARRHLANNWDWLNWLEWVFQGPISLIATLTGMLVQHIRRRNQSA